MNRLYKQWLSMVLTVILVLSSAVMPGQFVFAEEAVTGGLIISEYVEGGGYNKAIEIFNSSNNPINLGDYKLAKDSNGNGVFTSTMDFDAIDLAPRSTYVVVNTQTIDPLLALSQKQDGSAVNFNGDDVVQLMQGDTVIDQVGVFGDIDFGKDKTLVRKPHVLVGSATYDVDQWDVYDKDDISHIGTHTADEIPSAPTHDTIATAKSKLGEQVTIQAVVMSVPWPGNSNKSFYVQDNTAGCFIYTKTETSFSIGDKVRIVGTANVYNNQFQLKDIVSTELITAQVGAHAAQEILLSQINDDVTGELIALKNLTLTQVTADDYKNATMIVSQGTDTGKLYLDSRTGDSAEGLLVVANDTIHAQGIVQKMSDGSFRVVIRGFSDIEKVDGTPPDPLTNYYDDAKDLTGEALKAALNDIIDEHTILTYDQAYDALIETDKDPLNSENVILFYTGRSVNGAMQYNGGNGWNREHVWAKSHGDFGTSNGPGTDLHQLRPSDVSVNSDRGHLDFDMGGNPHDEAIGTFFDHDSWEPKDDIKGDVARILFYMATRYEGEPDDGFTLDLELLDEVDTVSRTATNLGFHGKLSTLLAWHESDPVSDFERQRNQVIYEDYQHNRNPFIDHPEYVAMIWGDNTPPVSQDVITIAAAKALPKGSDAKVEGIVLTAQGTGNSKSFYMQDDSAGVLVFTGTDKQLKPGMKVSLKGKTDDYSGKFEIVDLTELEIINPDAGLPEVQELDFKDINESHEGELVKVEHAVIKEVYSTNTYGSTGFTVLHKGFEGKLFMDNRTGTKFDQVTLKPGDLITVTGVVENFPQTAYQLVLRGLTDIVLLDIPDTLAPVITHTPVTEGNIARPLKITVDVSDDRIVKQVTLFYQTLGESDFVQAPMSLVEGIYSYEIPKEALSTAGIAYYILAEDVATNQTFVGKEVPFVVTLSDADISAPVLSVLAPEKNAKLPSSNLKPLIKVGFDDQSGIDFETVTLTVDGVDATTGASISNYGIITTPASDLALGEHIVVVSVKDTLGNQASETWLFTLGTQSYQPYFGQLHAHTTLSDGQGTVQEAYAFARDEGKADFFAITDHSNWFDNDLKNENITSVSESTSASWKTLNETADSFNKDGEFVAIAGYEMTWSGSTGGWGHINTFNTPWFVSRNNSSMDLVAYYNKLAQPENQTSINQLNHPGKVFGDFADFGFYSQAVDNTVFLIEVGNGEGPIRGTGYFPSYEYYTRALDKGWHVAPSNNQDNHKANFVTSNDARTVVLASELTREAIYSGIRNLRVYATEDKNLNVSYLVNGEQMGTSLKSPSNLSFDIDVTDPDVADKISKISVISDGGIVSASKSFDSNTVSWDFDLSPQYAYYYLKIESADGDIAVTAPVWSSEVVPVGLSEVKAKEQPTLTGFENTLYATVYNNTATALPETQVKFYLGQINEANLIAQTTTTSVLSGGTSTVSIPWTATKPGDYTIYAQTTLTVDGVEKVFTNSCKVNVFSPEDAKVIMLDGGHSNMYVTGDYSNRYEGLKKMMGNKQIILRVNTDELTASDLVGVAALIITDPASADNTKYNVTKAVYSDQEVQVIADYTANGGNLMITSQNDNYDQPGEYQNSAQGNKVLEGIGSNLRFNDDQVADSTNNYGSVYRLELVNFKSEKHQIFTTIDNVYRVYRACSVILKDQGSDAQVDWLVKGHDTTGTLDVDKANDNVPVATGDVSVLAAEVLPSGARIIVAGSTLFSDFEIDGDNLYANTPMTEHILNWLAPPRVVETVKISALKLDADQDGKLDLLGQRFAVEGYVTSESEAYSKEMNRKNAFFEVIYVQDETGGITVFGVSAQSLPIGTKVRVEGLVEQYDGDGEIQVTNESLGVKVIPAEPHIYQPKPMTTGESMLEANEGWLVEVTGKVTKMTDNALYLNDGSGEARVYVNGYIDDGSGDPTKQGKWDPSIKLGDVVKAIGLVSQDPEGHRLRVRNTAEITLAEDTIPPVITLSGVEHGVIYRSNLSPVIKTDEEALVTALIKRGNSATKAFVSGERLTANGIYTLTVNATDLKGNMSTMTFVFAIDKSNPSSNVTQGTPSTTVPGQEVLNLEDPITPLGAIDFSDMGGHWSKGAVNRLVALGAVKGYADGSFKPDHNILRSEMVSLVMKAFNKQSNERLLFKDMINHWAKDAVGQAAMLGYIKGYTDGTFKPFERMTREEVVVLLYRISQLNMSQTPLSFKDQSDLSDWAVEAVQTLASKGVITGYPDGRFDPKGLITRAEAVKIIDALLALQ